MKDEAGRPFIIVREYVGPLRVIGGIMQGQPVLTIG
jgi:hypothetical protein